jgi:hypothetical protein
MLGQLVEPSEGNATWCSPTSPPARAVFPRPASCRRAVRIDEYDPVVLVIIADESDVLVLEQHLRPRTVVPVDHLLAPVGLRDEIFFSVTPLVSLARMPDGGLSHKPPRLPIIATP